MTATAKAAISLVTLSLVLLSGWSLHHMGYKAGYAAHSTTVLTGQLATAETAIDVTKANVEESRATDVAFQTDQAAKQKESSVRATKLAQVMKTQEQTPRPPRPQVQQSYADAGDISPPTSKDLPNEEKPFLGQSVLDVFTLCLLDAERAGVQSPGSACAPERTDEEIAAFAATPSEVTGGDLAQNDQAVARLFNELKARHDGLVDWVDTNVVGK